MRMKTLTWGSLFGNGAGTARSALWVMLVAAAAAACGGQPDRAVQAALATEGEWFTDETQASGLDFVHDNGLSGEYYFPEHVAPGVGLLDFDNDGDLDLFFVQGFRLGSASAQGQPPAAAGPSGGPSGGRSNGGRLYRNDLGASPGDDRMIRFTDVTTQAGIVADKYGMGVAAGDFDNDGCVDLYVSNFGPNQLFRNRCDGTFTEVGVAAGVSDPGFSVSASFFDFDRDGWLDLFVGNYVQFSTDANVPCRSVTGRRDYCSPRVYRAQPNRLYRNRGDGTFADVTGTALVGGDFGPALGAAAADLNGDGWPDLFVANDGEPNELWINQRDGTFRNQARLAGVAVNADGKALAGMGVDAGDVDNDGDDDLFVTTLSTEMNTLFVNDGLGTFEDQTVRSGLGGPSLPYTGWGTAWVDVDNDGRLDLLTVNGTIEAQIGGKAPFPYDQRKQLFRNLGGTRFEEVTDQAGSAFQVSEVGRGAAFGDLNNDGAIDLAVANNHGPARVLINRMARHGHWIGLRLVGRPTRPRDMLGARVAIVRKDGTTIWRRAHADGSYASANDPRVLAGLGPNADAVRVRVIWPDGRTDEWPELPADRWTTLTEGGGS